MSATPTPLRNPGPRWGYAFLRTVDRWVPGWVLRPLLMLGTWVAVAAMPAPRRHSRDYLAVVLGRPSTWVEVWRHFFAFLEFLLLRLRAAGGAETPCVLDPLHGEKFEALLASRRPALFGTFHFGHSDLLGFLLAARGLRVSMVRLRVENSDDTRLLQQQFEKWISFIWVNDPAELLFALKAALQAGESLALQCDRFEYSARIAAFDFLGARRQFPVTIYHLALMFDRPVIFCLGVPDDAGRTRVIPSPVFAPDATLGRAENLRLALAHFQAVLRQLETLVRQHPHLWFNFRELNPVAPPNAESVQHAALRL